MHSNRFKFHLGELMELVAAQLAERASYQGVALDLRLPSELRCDWYGDSLSILQITLHLALRTLESSPGRPLCIGVTHRLDDQSEALTIAVTSATGDAERFPPGPVEGPSTDPELCASSQLLQRIGSQLVALEVPDSGHCLMFQVGVQAVDDGADLLLPAPGMGVSPRLSGLPEAMPGLDLALGLRRLMNESQLYLRLLSRFARDFRSSVRQLRDLLANGDQEGGLRLLHSLKGVAGNLGASTTYEAAARLEQELYCDAAPAPTLIDTLEKELDRALDSIDQLAMLVELPEEKRQLNSPVDIALQVGRLGAMLETGQFGVLGLVDQIPELLARVTDPGTIEELQQDIRRFEFYRAQQRLYSLYPTCRQPRPERWLEETGKPTVLLVDDMPVNISVLGMLFEHDYQVLVATSGERALELVGLHVPDIVLLDIKLPGIDGYEVCRSLRDNEATRNLPIIFVTARAEMADEEAGLAMGASDYVTKPFHLSIIRARVRTHLELKRKTDQLARMAAIDELTGLPNRRSFDRILALEWKRAVRRSARLGLIMIDVDEFKRYNDRYGHRDGDDCLANVGQCIGKALQRAGDFAGRYGGEEFVVLLPGADEPEVIAVAEGIRGALERLAIPHEQSRVAPYVTLSLGASLVRPSSGDSAREFIEHADALLYRAKQGGRNRVVFERWRP